MRRSRLAAFSVKRRATSLALIRSRSSGAMTWLCPILRRTVISSGNSMPRIRYHTFSPQMLPQNFACLMRIEGEQTRQIGNARQLDAMLDIGPNAGQIAQFQAE